MTENATERLPRRTKLMYGVGDTGFSITSTLISVYYLLFLTDVVGLRPRLPAGHDDRQTVDWINDPIVGYLSDRTRTRWGRRQTVPAGFIPLLWRFCSCGGNRRLPNRRDR